MRKWTHFQRARDTQKALRVNRKFGKPLSAGSSKHLEDIVQNLRPSKQSINEVERQLDWRRRLKLTATKERGGAELILQATSS